MQNRTGNDTGSGGIIAVKATDMCIDRAAMSQELLLLPHSVYPSDLVMHPDQGSLLEPALQWMSVETSLQPGGMQVSK